MTRKLLTLVLSLVMILTMFPAAMADQAGGTLKVFLDSDPETLDGQMTTDSYDVALNAFDRLIEADTVDGEPQLVPGLADSWDVSDDGLVYTFHLHQGVKFHNGNDFTAEDVVYSIDRMMNPAQFAKNYDIYDMIVGAKERFEGEADSISGVKAIDDYTVEVTLSQPYAPFLAVLATPGGVMLDSEATPAAGEAFGMDPAVTVGTGPFIVKDWVLGSEVTLEANKDYFKGAPKIDGLIYLIVPDPDTQRMLYETGEADIFNFDYAPSQMEFFKNDPQYADQFTSGARAGTYYSVFNQNMEPLNDVNVRKALKLALDRQAMLDALQAGEGVVANTFVPSNVLGHNAEAEVIEYNPELAKQLLAEAGYPDGFDMQIAQMTDSPQTLSMNEVYQAMMAQIGVRVEIVQMDSAAYYAQRGEGTLPSVNNSWSADFNDPDNFLYTFFSEKNSVLRSVNYQNTDVMQRLEAARSMTDPEARMAEYRAIEQIIISEDAAMIPLYSTNHTFLVNPRVKGFKVSWNGWNAQSFYPIELVG